MRQPPPGRLKGPWQPDCRGWVVLPAWTAGLLCLLAALLLLAVVVQACDTPVYQYTIQQWLRDPYHAYYFYSGTEATADAPVNGHLERIAAGIEGHVNIAFARVDVSNLASTEYTDEHREVWGRYQSHPLPFYVILTPRWTELFVGPLDLAAAQALTDSPKRRQIAEQLCQGKQGLLLLVLGPNQRENAAAQRVVRRVVAEAAERDEDIGFVAMARDAPQEKWLVRQLLQLEDDLQDLDSTMLFAVFGRSHILEPYLGKGITYANIAELSDFMKGPCACEIKASSAGMDLLTNYDWQTRVASLPPATEAPVHSLLFDIEEAPNAEVACAVPVPAVKAEEEKRALPTDQSAAEVKLVTSVPVRDKEAAPSAWPAASGLVARSETSDEDQKAISAPPVPDAQLLPYATISTDSHQSPLASFDRVRFSRPIAPDLEIEGNSSLSLRLSVRLGLMLGAAAILVVAIGFTLSRRRKKV